MTGPRQPEGQHKQETNDQMQNPKHAMTNQSADLTGGVFCLRQNFKNAAKVCVLFELVSRPMRAVGRFSLGFQALAGLLFYPCNASYFTSALEPRF